MKNSCKIIMAVLAFGAAAQCGAGEFTARFAGQQLRVHPARVSAFPMNQVWDMKGQVCIASRGKCEKSFFEAFVEHKRG